MRAKPAIHYGTFLAMSLVPVILIAWFAILVTGRFLGDFAAMWQGSCAGPIHLWDDLLSSTCVGCGSQHHKLR